MQADFAQIEETQRLLETAAEALASDRTDAADAALGAALRMPRVDLGSQDCAGRAATSLICEEIDRQAGLDWDDDLGGPSLDGLVERSAAVIAAFRDEDDDDLRSAFAYLTDMNLSSDGEARVRALTDDVRVRSPLDDELDDEQRRAAVLGSFEPEICCVRVASRVRTRRREPTGLPPRLRDGRLHDREGSGGDVVRREHQP